MTGRWVVGVTGVTGKTGRIVAELGVSHGWEVRSLTRRTPDIGQWFPMDWDDAASWPRAFAGCDAAYVIIPFNHPGAAQRTPAVLAAAAGAGVGRIVLLSSLDAGDAPETDPLRVAEDALVKLPVSWAIVRPTWFLDNFTVGSFASMMRDGSLRLPAGAGRIPFIAVSDIAAVAASALAKDGPTGYLPLTGPQAVTHADVCAALGPALGVEVGFTDVDGEEFVALMAQRGFDRTYCEFLIEALRAVERGNIVIPITDVVREITGRPALSLEEFAVRLGRDGEVTHSNA